MVVVTLALTLATPTILTVKRILATLWLTMDPQMGYPGYEQHYIGEGVYVRMYMCGRNITLFVDIIQSY